MICKSETFGPKEKDGFEQSTFILCVLYFTDFFLTCYTLIEKSVISKNTQWSHYLNPTDIHIRLLVCSQFVFSLSPFAYGSDGVFICSLHLSFLHSLHYVYNSILIGLIRSNPIGQYSWFVGCSILAISIFIDNLAKNHLAYSGV